MTNNNDRKGRSIFKPHLDAPMQWHGIGAKRSDLPALDYPKVETLTGEFIMVVLVPVGIPQPIDVLIPASALSLVVYLGR